MSGICSDFVTLSRAEWQVIVDEAHAQSDGLRALLDEQARLLEIIEAAAIERAQLAEALRLARERLASVDGGDPKTVDGWLR